MHSQLGAGLPQLLVVNELGHLSVAVSTGQATLLWRSSLLTMTTTSTGKCYTTYITYWNNFFLTRHIISITLDSVVIISV